MNARSVMLVAVVLLCPAMVLADKTLFIAGPPDVVNEEDLFSNPYKPEVQAKAQEQKAALKGSQGFMLQAVSVTDGKVLSEIKLKSSPVFDGMAAAENHLFITTTDGNIVCMEGAQARLRK